LMVEGGDLDPRYYNEAYNIAELDEYDPVKDTIETSCFTHAYRHGKPIMGFCRGMHIINALLGGKNHKDVHEANGHSMLHIDYNNYDTLRHNVNLVEGMPLYDWYGESQINVNSYHHQGIKELAPPLRAMASANDGLIEGVYLPSHPFLVGLQFHPERMYAEHSGNARVFDAFFGAIQHKS
jgi:putative glutamine amidotransferase